MNDRAIRESYAVDCNGEELAGGCSAYTQNLAIVEESLELDCK